MLEGILIPTYKNRFGGKATKRSNFGSNLLDQKKGTLATSRVCEEAYLSYHIVDSERTEHYLQVDEITQLAYETNKLKTILTISSRHNCASDYLRGIAALLRKVPRIGLNLVIGNSAYLSPREIESGSSRTLTNLVIQTRRLLPEEEIFIGTEGLFNTSLFLAKSYNLNPFLLLDRTLRAELREIRREIPDAKVALYTPYLVSDQNEGLAYEILTLFGPYVVRRKWVQERMIKIGCRPVYESVKQLIKESGKSGTALEDEVLGKLILDCASELGLYGDIQKVARGIHTLFEEGIDIVVGSPIRDCKKQVMALGRCVVLASSH